MEGEDIVMNKLQHNVEKLQKDVKALRLMKKLKDLKEEKARLQVYLTQVTGV